MNDKKKHKPPSRSAGDAVHAVTRAGLGTIPVVGAAATELLNAIVTPSLEKRRNQWMEEVGEALRVLEEKMDIVLESLQKNEGFIDVAIEASQMAIKTSNQEKRKALKNAILNSALPNPPEESLQKMFLSFIDTLTIWHIKLLELFSDPQSYLEKHNIQFTGYPFGSMSILVGKAFPELSGRRNLYDLIWKDLYSRALVTTEGLHTTMSGSSIIDKRTTEIAKLFLDYIKSPIEEETITSR